MAATATPEGQFTTGRARVDSQQNGSVDQALLAVDQKVPLDASPAVDSLPHAPTPKAIRKKPEESLMASLCATVVDHQIGLSVNLLLLLFLTHISFPKARRRTRTYLQLSYHDPVTDTYTQGWDDMALVSTWIVAFTGLRVAVMDYILVPLAKMGGVEKPKARVRFAEQGWLLIYYCVFWTLGMTIMYDSSYWFNLREMWTNFPTRSMSGTMKWYYLVQFAFWLQQILVVNVEERRKDYAQMFSHHIITSCLIFFSYAYYQTKVGNVILCLMDPVDILLPAAKILRYLNYRTACDITFGLFMVTWFVARHVFYLMVCWSIYADVPSIMDYGCYSSLTGAKLGPNQTSSLGLPSDGGIEILPHLMQSLTNPDETVCFNSRIRYAFLSLLLGLQVITCIWFGMIIRVAYRVLSGQGAEDDRSDGEESEEEVEPEDHESEKRKRQTRRRSPPKSVPINVAPLEEEVGVEGLHFTRRSSPSFRARARKVPSAGPNRPGTRAGNSMTRGHKELLDRVGCEKKIGHDD